MRFFAFISLILSLSLQAQRPEISKRISQIRAQNDSEKGLIQLDSLLNNANVSKKQEIEIRILQTLYADGTQQHHIVAKACTEGIRLARQLKNDSAEAHFYKSLAIMQYFSNNREESVKTMQKSLDISRKHGLDLMEAQNLNNLGGILIDLEHFSEAEQYLKQSLSASAKIGVEANINRIKSTRLLATLYQRTRRSEQSEALYLSVIKDAKSIKDTSLLSATYQFYGTWLYDQKRFKEAESIARESITLLKNYGHKQNLRTAYMFLRNALAANKLYQEAYQVQGEIQALSDQIYNEDNQAQRSELETRFKTRELEQAKKLAESQAETSRRKNQFYQILLAALLAFFLAIWLLFILIRRNKKAQQREKNRQLQIAALIEGEEKERGRIARELHDGIVQDLTAIGLQMDRMEQNKAISSEDIHKLNAQLKETRGSIRDIAYQMLPATLRELNLADALESLFEKNFNPADIAYHFTHFGVDGQLPEKLQLGIYRICQELTQNVIKHSDASEINIVLRLKEKQLTLVFEDNGKGFDPKKTNSGIGLNSLQSRIDLLNGHINIDSENDKGTVVYLRFQLT